MGSHYLTSGYFGLAPIALPAAPTRRTKQDDGDGGIGLAIAAPLVLDAVFSPSPPDYGTGAGLDSMGAPIDSGGGGSFSGGME